MPVSRPPWLVPSTLRPRVLNAVRIDPLSGSFGYRREPARGLPRETFVLLACRARNPLAGAMCVADSDPRGWDPTGAAA